MSTTAWGRLFSAALLNLFVSSFFILAPASSYAAGFSTNFQPIASSWGGGSNTGYCTFGTCITGHNYSNGDPTPFEEMIVVINNVRYIHTLVGDPASGFAVESYTRWGPSPNNSTVTNDIPDQGGVFSPDGGGNARSVIDPGNTVSGSIIPPGGANTRDVLQNDLNMNNALGDYRISGTGSNDPSQTVFRMVMTTADMSLDVSKPFLDKKPMISQTVQDGTMSSVFVTDMRSLSYTDGSTSAPVINNLVLNDPGIPGAGAADFEMALAQNPDITAGRFTFTRGTGWNTSGGWDVTGSTFGEGTYSYVGGQGFDPLNFNWASVFDYAQNAFACSNAPANERVVREDHGNFGGSCFNKP